MTSQRDHDNRNGHTIRNIHSPSAAKPLYLASPMGKILEKLEANSRRYILEIFSCSSSFAGMFQN